MLSYLRRYTEEPECSISNTQCSMSNRRTAPWTLSIEYSILDIELQSAIRNHLEFL